MIELKFLNFLKNKSHFLYVMNCASAYEYIDDLFQRINIGRYCNSDIDLGIVYLFKSENDDFLIIDGKRRFLSLILLFKALQAVEEKKKQDANSADSFIDQTFSYCIKYLGKPKLQLFGFEKTIFDKIINSETLTYNEQQTEIYKIYEMFVENIENLDYDFEEFCSIVSRLTVRAQIVDNVQKREIFYHTNKDLRQLNQILLIKSFLAELNHGEIIDNLLSFFSYKEEVLTSFIKSFLSPKYNHTIKNDNALYTYFVNYFNMIDKYQSFDDFEQQIFKSAKIFKRLYHADFLDSDLRNILIKIISNNGRDTFSYLLELCEDYDNKLLSKNTLLEICEIINTYLTERNLKDSYTNFDFSQMATELNKVIYEQQDKNPES